MNAIEQYIRAAAQARGINPDVAVKVAMSEGGLSDPTRQSLVTKNGAREPSYGPFQLLIGGGGTGFPEGMGNRALAAGIDPRDPNQWQRGVDFALDSAKQGGWSPWYGAKAAGIDNWAGINGNAAPALKQSDYPPSDIGGIGSPTATGQNQPTFGTMAPTPGGGSPFSILPAAAEIASGDKPNTFGNYLARLGAALEKPVPGARPPAMGDARATSNMLLNALSDKDKITQALLQRRLHV